MVLYTPERAAQIRSPNIRRRNATAHQPEQVYTLDVFDAEETEHWNRNAAVVPMHFFAMPFEGDIVLSDEHTEVRWLPYQEAYDLVYYFDQKIALYELNQRLQRDIMLEQMQ